MPNSVAAVTAAVKGSVTARYVAQIIPSMQPVPVICDMAGVPFVINAHLSGETTMSSLPVIRRVVFHWAAFSWKSFFRWEQLASVRTSCAPASIPMACAG